MSNTKSAHQKDTDQQAVRVLIVEDEPMVAEALKGLLCDPDRSEFSCSQAETLAECLSFLRRSPCDIVLLDLGLPDSRGLDTAAVVRKEFPGLPILVLTGLTDEETAIQAMSMDIQDYLVKSQMHPALLSRSIRYAIDRKRSVDALRQSEAAAWHRLRELENLYDTALVGLCVADREYRHLRINKRLAEIDGLPTERIIGRTFREVIPRIADQVEAACDRVFLTGEPFENVEIAGWTRSNLDTERHWLESFYPLKNSEGRVVAVNIVVKEITELKQSETALREREERYRALVNAAASVVWRTSADGLTLLELRRPSELSGEPTIRHLEGWLKLVHPEDREQTAETWRRSVAGKSLFEIENRNLHADGTYHYFLSRAAPVLDHEGRVREWIGLSIDITARKQMEESLRESEHRLELATQAAEEGVWDWDVATGSVVTNDIYIRNFGMPPAGRPFLEWWTGQLHPEDRHGVLTVLSDLAEGRRQTAGYEYRFRRPDGSWCDVLDRAKAVKLRLGKPERVIGVMMDISGRKRAEEELRVSEQRFREVFDHAPVGMVIMDLQAGYEYVNDAFSRIVDHPRHELLQPGADVRQFTHPDDLPATLQGLARLLRGEIPAFFSEKRYVRKDGSPIWVRVSSSLRRDVAGTPVQIVSLVEEIGERKQAEQALRESEERFRTLADNISQLAWMADASGWVFWFNKRWFDYTGAGQEQMRGWGWQSLQHPEHRERVMKSYREAMEKGDPWEETFPLRGRDGSFRWFLCRATPIRSNEGNVVRWFGTNTDITERRRMEEEVRHLAQHDALTGLPNRRLFNEIIKVELAQARRNGTKAAILFLDLDRFKEINDTLGHGTGDELLMQTAQRLRAAIRTSDTVARIGGDEFNLLIPDVAYPEYAAEVAQKVLQEIRRPFQVKGHELNVSTSIGISVFPDDGAEIDTLMRYADMAMYYAKEHGRNMLQFYNPVINTRSLERIRFENSLRRAVDNGEFLLFYQPMVDLRTRRVESVEALLRWRHPERGLLLPEQFFAAAEEIGFMPEIDDWVLRTAGLQSRSWRQAGARKVCVTVNLSQRRFESPGLVQKIASVLSESGLSPACLDLEITETTAMQHIENTVARLRELSAMGVRVSIDNFGIGYSSLTSLKRMPVGKLKLDRSFIREIPGVADDRAIVAGVLLMAHSLNMKVVAAGVEAEEQVSFLLEAHCDEAQGYLFGRPVSAERMGELLAA